PRHSRRRWRHYYRPRGSSLFLRTSVQMSNRECSTTSTWSCRRMLPLIRKRSIVSDPSISLGLADCLTLRLTVTIRGSKCDGSTSLTLPSFSGRQVCLLRLPPLQSHPRGSRK